jgi:predicted lipoprotein
MRTLLLLPLILAIPAQSGQFSRSAMLRNVATKVIAPAYQDLAAKARALTNAVEQLASVPDERALDQARQAWSDTLLAARSVQAFQIGPVVDREYASSFYYWQVLPLRIEAVVESDRSIDKKLIDELGATAKGLFALEYLLFGRAQNEPLKLLASQERRRNYTVALARDIEAKARQLASDWARADGSGAAARFAGAGQESVNVLVNQLAQAIETVAEGRINFTLSLPQPVSRQLERVEGSSSGSSVKGAVAILEGIQRIYAAGLNECVKDLNQSLEKRIREHFDAALAAMRAIPGPLENAVVEARPAVESAYKATRALEILFKVDLPSALGVTITFSSTDGD